MTRTLVDTNVLLDVVQDDPNWFEWSAQRLAEGRAQSRLCINAIIYTELCQRYASRQQVDEMVAKLQFDWLDLSRDCLYLAAQAFGVYKAREGRKLNVLADFFIGAQALQLDCKLLTRDARRYRTYFPAVELISPTVN
jgi:predicted nucleic acid-binding protein